MPGHGCRLIVILNDNDMSIAPPVGAMSSYLARLVSTQTSAACASSRRSSSRTCPIRSRKAARRAEEFVRGMVMGGTLFEELGFLLCRARSTGTISISFCRC
jgi:1-deoxy-D-xylulose-5-phosphate synthase